MSEKRLSVEEIMQKIDQVLIVLKEISQDLTDISKALRAAGVPSPTSAAPKPAPATSERTSSIIAVSALFPPELEDMLFFEDKKDYIEIKPRRFLGSDNFGKIASIVRGAGGEYVSAGRESHFKIPKQA